MWIMTDCDGLGRRGVVGVGKGKGGKGELKGELPSFLLDIWGI
jgi:hypothetical protein